MDIEPVLCQSIIFSDLTIREFGTDKITMVGSFTQFNAPHFPFIAGPFHVTVLVTNIPATGEDLPVTIRVEQSGSGHVLASVSGSITLPPTHTREDVAQVVFGFGPTAYVAPGKYDVVVLVKNEPIGKRPLFIKSISSSTTTQRLENQ